MINILKDLVLNKGDNTIALNQVNLNLILQGSPQG